VLTSANLTNHDDGQSRQSELLWHEVALISWPSAEPRRVELRDAGLPRLLIVAEDCDPPITEDVLEDWVRSPSDPRDVQARVSTLRTRLARHTKPHLDDDGRLHVGERWIALSPIDRRLVNALLDRFGTVASKTTLASVGWPAGVSSRSQLDVHMVRLRRRLEPLGLTVRTVHAKGYALDRR
jgi:hypothetical protein